MRYRDILIPLVCAAGGFAAGWYAHKKTQTDRTAEALKQQSDMYKEKLKEANDILQDALKREAITKQQDTVEKVKNWRDTLSPGFFAYDEYDDMFKTPAPPEAIGEDEPTDDNKEVKKIGEEEKVRKPWMDWHGDPIDDIVMSEGDDDDDFIPEEPDEAIWQNTVDYPILYVRPEEVGEYYGYQEVNLVVYKDGIVTDDAGTLVPIDEVPDMIGEDYESHFGEYAEEALWAMNRRNHTYYEVLQDSRTYRESIGRG